MPQVRIVYAFFSKVVASANSCPLANAGIAAPTIIGVDWRLDYSIKSKNAGRENASMFFVSLKVKDRGVVREINMIASIEELQDLLSKVNILCCATAATLFLFVNAFCCCFVIGTRCC